MEVITHAKHNENISNTERWASAIAGGALAIAGLERRSPLGLAMALVGGELVRRGTTGHCFVYEAAGIRSAPLGQGSETTSVPYELGIRVDETVTVNKPRNEVFRFWRNLENLPRFMEHLESVHVEGEQSRWVAKAPAGKTVEWRAQIHSEVENERIAWRSLPGSDVDNAGSVLFSDAPGNRGTIIRVELQYNPPGGVFGALAAKLWGEEPSQQVKGDLYRFKRLMEAGEILTIAGQPSGRSNEEKPSGDLKAQKAEGPQSQQSQKNQQPQHGQSQHGQSQQGQPQQVQAQQNQPQQQQKTQQNQQNKPQPTNQEVHA